MGESQNAEALVKGLERTPEEWLGPNNRVVNQAHSTDEDIYTIFGSPSKALEGALTSWFGKLSVEAMASLDTSFGVSDDVAAAFLGMIHNADVVGTYDELIGRRDDNGVPERLVQPDHLIDVRLHRMLRDGREGHEARSRDWKKETGWSESDQRRFEQEHFDLQWSREQIKDGLCILLPANEVVAYRLSRAFQGASPPTSLPWLYPHPGLGSKSERMKAFIPWAIEGIYSHQEILDATIWVLVHERGLPDSEWFRAALREDLINSILIGAEDDGMLQQYLSISDKEESDARDQLTNDLDIGPDRTRDLPSRWRFSSPIEL